MPSDLIRKNGPLTIEVNKNPHRAACPSCLEVSIFNYNERDRTLHCPHCGYYTDENFYELESKEVTYHSEGGEMSHKSQEWDRGVLVSEIKYYHPLYVTKCRIIELQVSLEKT